MESWRIQKSWPVYLLLLQNIFPALAVRGALDEWSGFGHVGGAQVRVVPLDFLPSPISNVAELVRFGRPTGVMEVQAGHWTVPFGVVDPLDPIAGRAGQGRGRRLEVLGFLVGQQLPIAEQHPFRR